MAGQAEIVTELLDMTHRGVVFGEGVAFGELDESRRAAIAEQTAVVAGETAGRLTVTLLKALADNSAAEVATHVRQIVPKAAAFMPALTAGELTGEANTEQLIQASTAVSYMYAADQLIDRGDKPMADAVRFFDESTPERTYSDEAVNERAHIMRALAGAISKLGGEEAPDILDCYTNVVLKNEVALQSLSDRYGALDEEVRPVFLRHFAPQIAARMVADAGFQSVTSSLHTIYRQNDLSLPTIREIHANPEITRLLRTCNAVARVADERGDWQMDAGENPEYGKFSINPFNQYDRELIASLCEQAGITHPDGIDMIDMHFRGFKDAEVPAHRVQHGAAITNSFFNRMRAEFSEVEDRVPENYQTYLTLCRRVGEICHVNMLGDIRMAGNAKA